MKHRQYKGGRARGRCLGYCCAGYCAIDAQAEVAHDLQLAEVARHVVWRRGRNGQGGCQVDRQQLRNSGLRRRRNRSRLASLGRDLQRHRRDEPHGVLLLFRQGSDLRLRHLRVLRPQFAPEPGLVLSGRRQGSAQRVLQEIQCHDAGGRQHHLSDGWLVS